ncbi:MAG TPA: nucleoside hydrolase, partial [Actinomycetota bacterium]|nr:nucleoside hydrolase [Actinomycetota bacterium]
IDDAIAILLALASPELDVRGITVVHGNVPVEACTLNALKVLDLVGRRDVPVVTGAAAPLVRPPRHAETVHGPDGLGGLFPPPDDARPFAADAAAFIAGALEETDEPTTLISLGPLTNVATAILATPGVIERLERIVSMGGAIRREGNVTPAAEFNIFADPEAAAIVFRSGVPITLVPLDATMRAVFPGEAAARLAGSEVPVERAVGELGSYVSAVYRTYYGIDGFALHDPLAVGAAIDPTLVTTQDLWVTVETRGELTAGATLADFWHIPEPWGEPNASVALDADGDRFLEFLCTRLFGRFPV